MLVETWLNKDYSDNELYLTGYDTFRFDCDNVDCIKKRGGGVLIAVKKELKAKKVIVPINRVEQIFISINLGDQIIVCGAVYIPPLSGIDVYVEQCNTVEEVFSQLDAR